MDHNVHAVHRAHQAFAVADIADEITQRGVVEPAHAHLVLLEFVAAEDDDLLRLVFLQHYFSEFLPKDPVPPVMRRPCFPIKGNSVSV
jgi:hypothetical protein